MTVRVTHLLAVVGLSLVLQTGAIYGHDGYHEQIDAMARAVEKSPSDPRLRFELAHLHGLHGDVEPALKNLDRVDALAPGKFQTDLLRAEAFMVARQYAKAKEVLDRELVSQPKTPRAWLLRARAERELDQEEASVADYREALRRNSSPDPDIVQEVAGALVAAGKKEEAAEVLAAGIQKLGRIPSLVLRALDLEIETKNFEGALRRIEQARQDAPRPEPWMARRAAVLAQAGQIDESRAAWKALLDHLDALPERERASRAMTKLKADAREALSDS